MLIFLLLMYAVVIKISAAYGYDAGTDQAACGRPLRGSRMMRPPCDLRHQSYCTSAGNTYPWQAVRRFIRENQGLMRRMYGDERHLSVLRDDLRKRQNEVWENEDGVNDEEGGDGDTGQRQDERLSDAQMYKGVYDEYLLVRERYAKQRNEEIGNDIDDAVPLVTSARYLHENNDDISTVLKTKFIYSDLPGKAVKIKDLNLPYFRPTTSTTERIYTYTEPPTKQKVPEEMELPKSTASNNSITNFLNSSTANNITEATNTTSISANLIKTGSIVDAEFSESNNTFSFTLEDVMEDDTTEVDINIGNRTKDMDELEEILNSTTINTNEAILETTTLLQVETREKLKKPVGEVLFQDMDDEATKNNQNVNYNNLKGINACPVKEEVVAPFWANNTRGEVLALLNLYPFEQYVHWEKCTYEHRQMYCREGCRCEQQYRLHRLLAYDPNNECRGIFSDWFRFPSCCVCKCYDMPVEFRVTSRSPRKIIPGPYERSPDTDEHANKEY